MIFPNFQAIPWNYPEVDSLKRYLIAGDLPGIAQIEGCTVLQGENFDQELLKLQINEMFSIFSSFKISKI